MTEDRKSKGFAKLAHADFMKKVPEVLGERAGNFSCTFRSQARTRHGLRPRKLLDSEEFDLAPR